MSKEVISTKKTIGNIFKVAVGNIVKLLSGVLVGFLLPKIIGVTDYGYYKTFTLYAAYSGLFAFGMADGIYLKYGGKNYDDLDKSKFRFYTVFYFFLELISSVVIAVLSLVFLNGEIRYIFICLAIYIIFNNITNYFQIISQITGRFNELSVTTLIHSFLTVFTLILFWMFNRFSPYVVTYKSYMVLYIFITAILALWYIFAYRDITFGKQGKINAKDIFEFIKIGAPLLIANLCSYMIFALDRQFVSVLFDTDTYAVYAFAYSMLGLITTALSAVSTVIYPTLKRTDKETLQNNYSLLVEIVLVCVFACLLIYFPLCWFVPWFLPRYTSSLIIFRIILPGLAVSSAVTIVMHNYYKTMGQETNFFIKSIIVLFVSAVANYIAYKIFKTTQAISIASIIVLILWYIFIESYFVYHNTIKRIKNFTYLILMSAGFYLITCFELWWAAMLIYFVFLFVVTYLFFYKDINKFVRKLLNNIVG